MHIHVFVDVYPHPFKPYLDVQFEEWQKSGHIVRVFSLSRIPYAVSPVSVCTIKTLREAPFEVFARIAFELIRSPKRIVAVALNGKGLLQKMKLLAIDCQLPRELPDLFFVHNLATCLRFEYLKHIFPRVPLALYYHGGEIPGVPTISDEQAKHALSSPDVIFTNTNYSVDDVVQRGAQRSKVKRIPVGFRLEDYHSSTDRSYMKNDRFQIVSVGRIAIEKGFDVAVKALAVMKKTTNINFEYVIVGDGPEMQNIRNLVQESGIGDSVRLLGILNNKDVISVLSNADVLVLSSVPANTCQETQACVMQEAMLMGAVVVASDIGGIRESVPKELCEYLFKAGDHHQLSNNLVRLFSTGASNIRRLGHIGKEFVKENYDVRKLNKMLLHYSIKMDENNGSNYL
jgi:glycosyltransferase involved in cell wall biosynthesis